MEELNKDLILREQLAIQRTRMANQTTLLSFMRTSLYFGIAGLSMRGLLSYGYVTVVEVSFYIASIVTFVFGWMNFYAQLKRINRSRIHIGNYKMEYFKEHSEI